MMLRLGGGSGMVVVGLELQNFSQPAEMLNIFKS